jgi:hypothetical protein
MADGAYRWQGCAPEPDPARVEALDAAFDGTQPHAFSEPVRAAARERLERALAEVRTAALGGAAARLAEARQTLDALRPAELEPRRGLAGLFDSRRRRLRRFRDSYGRAAAALSEAAADLAERLEGVARRSAVLDGLWSGLRDAVVDLDAHRLVAARRLADRPPPEGEPHPLDADLAVLDACRASVLAALPLLRNVQNAEARAAARLQACADGVAAWRDDWKDALGLAGRRPKRVRPDPERLLRLRDDLRGRIDGALAELAAAGARRGAAERRLSELSATS